MKIAIEAQRIFRRKKHGMDFVALETIKELQKIDRQNEYFIFVRPGEDRGVLKPSDNFHIVELKCPSYPLWEQVALPLAVKKIKADFLHCTSNTAPLFCSIPLIITLHDIIFLDKPKGVNTSVYQLFGRYYRKLIVPPAVRKSYKVITVSNYEAEKISRRLNLGRDKLEVIYNGVGEHFKSAVAKNGKYILFFGNTDPKKNTVRVLKAYSLYLLKSQFKLPLFVVDLKREHIVNLLKKSGSVDVLDNIYSPGYIDNSRLPAIYSEASIFLYPSLAESFGMPILEAMACGTPVITSNLTAMPEIAGDAAITVNPYDEIEIANAILKIENDRELKEKMEREGLLRASQFSWNNTALSLLNLYNNIMTD